MSTHFKQSRIRQITRRASLLTGVSAMGTLWGQTAATTPTIAAKQPLSLSLVKEFVGVAHVDLNRVQVLLESEPALLNASWDWGLGDFETAMGAAGHMGRPDIAEFLLSKGARMDLFCAAMLGQIEIVGATLRAYPQLKTSKGPHGIPLELHAQAGLKKGITNCSEVLKLIASQ